MIIREARAVDNDQLLLLTRLTPMDGKVKMRMDREPDFFALTRERGDSVVLVAEEESRIIGVISASEREVYCLGEKRKVWLVAGFKAHPDRREHQVSYHLTLALKKELQARGADLVFCTVVEGNEKVRPFLEGRLGFPPFDRMGQYLIRLLTPRPFSYSPPSQFDFSREESSSPNLEAFYHRRFQQDYAWSVAYVERICHHCEHLIARLDGEIVAAISIFDPKPWKQVVITDAPLSYRLLLFFSRQLARVLPQLPCLRLHEPLPILDVRLLACREDQTPALRSLLQQARRLAWQRKYMIMAAGLDARDPLNQIFRGIPSLSTRLNAYFSNHTANDDLLDEIQRGLILEDYSIL